MGSLNCVRAKCSLGFTADRAGDQMLDLKATHTAAAGVSRTDAQIMVMVRNWLFVCDDGFCSVYNI